ncbi:unnamed protein product, partial [Ilex paraguariensis]
ARIGELNSMVGSDARNRSLDNNSSSPFNNHLLHRSTGEQDISLYHNYIGEQHLETVNNVSRLAHGSGHTQMKSLSPNGGTHQFPNNDNLLKQASNTERNLVGTAINSSFDRSGATMRSQDNIDGDVSHPTMRHGRVASFVLEEEGPGIEGFQIIGDAKPGGTLSGCGYPVRGTSLCMFQWVRHLPDGTRQYIEGATNPEYIVTADDVDKLIAVECIPMNDQGRQGELVRLFANDQNKITCVPKMGGTTREGVGNKNKEKTQLTAA